MRPPCSGSLGAASSQTTLHTPNYFWSPKRIKISSPPSPARRDVKPLKQDLCQVRESFPPSPWGNSRGKEGDFQVAFNLHQQNSSPFRAAFDTEPLSEAAGRTAAAGNGERVPSTR